MNKSNMPVKRGGSREGAGRKPVDEPKEAITIYAFKSDIKAWGGKKTLKEKLTALVGGGMHLKDEAIRRLNPISQEAAIALHNAENPNQFTELITVPESTFDKAKLLARIKELEDGLKNPPKNPIVGLSVWKRVREKELFMLKKQLANDQ